MPDAGDALAPYDVVLLGSFGGPEAPDEVVPFLRRVTAGRDIPDARLEAVGEHYFARGGRSPINDLNRDLLVRLRAELDRRGIDTPLLWGNRNCEPFFADALHEALDLGATRVVTLLTSAYSCYSSCRQYREDLAAAVDAVGPAADGLVVDKVRPYAVHPGGRPRLAARARRVGARAARPGIRAPALRHPLGARGDGRHVRPGRRRGQPLRRPARAPGPPAHRRAQRASSGLEVEGELVFCSRSGPPTQPWLEPDVNDRIEELAAAGRASPSCAPRSGSSPTTWRSCTTSTPRPPRRPSGSGCRSCGWRPPAPTTLFVEGLVDLLLERAAEARGEVVVPETWLPGDVRPSVCAPGCCPNLRTAKPALCGSD